MCYMYFWFCVLTIAKFRANVWPVKLVVVDSLFIAAPIVYERLCFVLTVSEVRGMFGLKC